MDKPWMAFDVGCYECGEPSGLIGLYATEAEARAACDEAATLQAADWTGQHAMQVHNLVDESQWSSYRPRVNA